MSAIGKKIIDTALQSLEIIGELASEAIGADPARAKMIAGTIKVIVDTVRAGHARDVSPEDVIQGIEAAIDQLKTSVADERQQIKTELDEDFKTAETPATPTP